MSLLERLPVDLLPLISRHLCVTDLRRLQRTSRALHALASRPQVWEPRLVDVGVAASLASSLTSMPISSLVLLLCEQPHYSRPNPRATLTLRGLTFTFAGDLPHDRFCNIKGDLRPRYRPRKPNDPPTQFKNTPSTVLELRLKPTSGWWRVYDVVMPAGTDDFKSESHKFSFVFTAPGCISLRRSTWKLMKPPVELNAQ